jgi:hypothetical protein
MRHAIFTIAQDEPFFLPVWYRYYSGHFAHQHIYVLKHPLPGEVDEPDLGITRGVTRANVLRVYNDKSFDHNWLRRQVEKFAEFLLGSYDTVTFAEVDEIIALDEQRVDNPSLITWLDAWATRKSPAARCTGYEVVHRFDVEPNLDQDDILHGGELMLRHRRWWCPSVLYSKVLTWRIPPHWNRGFHDAFLPMGHSRELRMASLPREPELLLLHLHKVDYPVAVDRWQSSIKRDWNEADLQDPQAGIQNRFENEDQLKQWWYTNVDDWKLGPAQIVEMPGHIRSII